jgi:hypothetical protein
MNKTPRRAGFAAAANGARQSFPHPPAASREIPVKQRFLAWVARGP